MRIPVTVKAKVRIKSVDIREIGHKTHMITVSAVCKFKPRPPALVDKMNTLYSESLALNI